MAGDVPDLPPRFMLEDPLVRLVKGKGTRRHEPQVNESQTLADSSHAEVHRLDRHRRGAPTVGIWDSQPGTSCPQNRLAKEDCDVPSVNRVTNASNPGVSSRVKSISTFRAGRG